MNKVVRQSYRLGFGEVDGAAGEQARFDARLRFLNAIRSVKPKVLDDLADKPLAAYRSAATAFGRHALPGCWDDLVVYADDEEWAEVLGPLRDALDQWARRWNLFRCEPWCLAITLQTLDVWARSPAWLESREWASAYGGFLATRAEERRFRFEHEGWEPTSDTRRVAKAAIHRAFDRELDAYLDRIAALATERGFASTPTKRKDAGFEWLARFIVDKCSCGEIAREIGKTRRAVEIAVNEVALRAGVRVEHRPN